LLLLAAPGCGKVDTFRLAHANGGTPVDWPPGVPSMALQLEPSSDGLLWLPVAVDGSPPVPFLLQASAGAIALSGARASGFGPAGAGSLALRDDLLPGIRSGLLIGQRRLGLGDVTLGDQSMLLVDPGEWPHRNPGRGAAGVLGYDLLRRFVVELDTDARSVTLYPRGRRDVGRMVESQRLAVLGRIPYFEAWMEPRSSLGRPLRLQFEPAAPVSICLDDPGAGGMVVIAGQEIPVPLTPCPADDGARLRGERDGVFGAGALRGMLVAVDYDSGRIGFGRRD
jgi:hypothetical protein